MGGRPRAVLTLDQERELPELEGGATTAWNRRSQAQQLRRVFRLATQLAHDLRVLARAEESRRERENDAVDLLFEATGIAGVDRDGIPLWVLGRDRGPARPSDYEAMARFAEAVKRGIYLATAFLYDEGGLPLPSDIGESSILARLARKRGFPKTQIGRVAAPTMAGADAARKADDRRAKRLEPEREIARENIAVTKDLVREQLAGRNDPGDPDIIAFQDYVADESGSQMERVAELRTILGIVENLLDDE